MLKNGISVNPNWVNVILETSKIKNKKLHKKILKENPFVGWLINNYKVKVLDFGTVNV